MVGIEGKVNEPCGETIGEYRPAARRRAERGEPTNAPQRLDEVTRAIAGWVLPEDDQDGRRLLRYQLFSAVAGTVAAAAQMGAALAVFCVNELLTRVSDTAAQETNAADLDSFLMTVFPDAGMERGERAWIAGPLALATPTERMPAGVSLYIAKVSSPVA